MGGKRTDGRERDQGREAPTELRHGGGARGALRAGERRDDGSEAVRRARLVARYAAIPLPDEEDDRRYAELLGLSVDSLLRLTAAWRLHGDARFLQGARPRQSTADRSAARRLAPEDVDMDAIPSDRVDETRRRIAVIHRFLQLEAPTPDERQAAAAEFGVLANRFTRIVKSWVLHRDPRVIPGATSPRREWRRNQSARHRIRDMFHEIMATLGEKATVAAAGAILKERCRREGLRSPGRSTLYEWSNEPRGTDQSA